MVLGTLVIGEKNAQAIVDVSDKENLDEEKKALLQKLVSVYGTPKKVLPTLDVFCVNDRATAAVRQLQTILDILQKRGMEEKICVDFSVVNDMNYYNGIAFKGFVEGVPVGVLSGGQYDGLMKKMGKKAKAVGFAVYLDEISKRGERV